MYLNDGYYTGTPYTFGYYPEFNINSVQLALLLAGVEPPKFKNVFELGFGNGLNLAIDSAATIPRYFGNDYMQEHVSFLRELVPPEERGNYLGSSFKELAKRDDLPKFDYIYLHGIFSWIGEDGRQDITEFISKNIARGGIVQVSYNNVNGWAASAPLQRMMLNLGKSHGHDVRATLSSLTEVHETGALPFKLSPQLKRQFESLRKESDTYIKHEYFNANHELFDFIRAGQYLSNAGLEYVCSGEIVEDISWLQLSKEQIKLIGRQKDRAIRECISDYIRARMFRKDIWAFKPSILSEGDKLDALAQLHAVRVGDVSGSDKINGSHLTVSLNNTETKRVLERFTKYEKIRLRDLGKLTDEFWRNFILLVAKRKVLVANSDLDQALVEKNTQALNSKLIEKSRGRNLIRYLASPVLGSAITVNPVIQGIKRLQRSDPGMSDRESVEQFLRTRTSAVKIRGIPVRQNEAGISSLLDVYKTEKKHAERLAIF